MAEFRDYKDYGEIKERDDDVQYFCKFTFGQFFTILVMEVVTLAFVFYLGAKYGTNYLKIDIENDGPKVTSVVAGSPSAQTEEIDTGAASPIQDAEIQALARDVIKGGGGENKLKEKVRELLDKQQETQNTALAPQKQIQTDTRIDLGPEPATERTAAVSSAPKEPEAPAPAKAESASATDGGAIRVKSSSTSPFSIQVGSYPNMEEASSKVEEWRTKGYPSFMMIADIPDRGRWYRVRIGGFASKESATDYLAKIRQNEGVEGIVVSNE